MNPWDERYSSEGFYYGDAPNDFLKETANLITPRGRVLCLAEGEGRNAVFLAGLGYSVHAVDQSGVGLQKARDLASSRGVLISTEVADLEQYSIPAGEYDAIVSIWAHVPPSFRGHLHQKGVAGLKPGGLFILEAYHPRQLNFKTGGPPTAELMMTLKDLEGELKGLQFLRAQELNRDVQEGKGHRGMSAVTQILGKKL